MSRKLFLGWLTGSLACLLLVAVCFQWLDLQLAEFFRENIRRAQSIGLSSTIILSGELAAICILSTVRTVKGRLPDNAKALMIALLASIVALTANDYILKILFGVPPPAAVILQAAHHRPHFLVGRQTSSFPSGHMALAGGFAGFWMRLYPTTTLALAILLALGMTILVVGDWHFASDVIAGTFVGITAGLAAGTLWLIHTQQREG